MTYVWPILVIAAQIYFCVHAYRSGRERWIFIIIFLPVIGMLIYLFVAFIPDMERRGVIQNIESIRFDINKLTDPTKDLRMLREQLEFSPTFENKQRLARECVRLELYDEAIDLYHSALTGIFENDPRALYELACTYHLRESYDEAIDTLDRLRSLEPDYNFKDVGLVYAQTLEKQDKQQEALREYEALLQRGSTYEAKCRHALLLQKMGQVDEAQRLFRQVIASAERADRHQRRSQRQWINVARQNLVD